MSLVVENGTGLPNAESYVSVADATARHAALGNTGWATVATDALREQALRRATVYMEQAYRQRWKGTRLLREQALSWPRYGAQVDGADIASTVVPVDVANTCADLALKAVAGDLNADVTPRVIREKVGPLETEYDRYGPQSTQYRGIDMALAPYLTGGGAMARLVRT